MMKKLAVVCLALAALLGGAGCAHHSAAAGPQPRPGADGLVAGGGRALALTQDPGWTIGFSAADSNR